MNITQLKQLETSLEPINKLEDEIFKIIPQIFLNFLGLNPNQITKAIKTQSDLFSNQMNVERAQNLSIMTRYVEMTSSLISEIDFQVPGANSVSPSFFSQFLNSLNIVQHARARVEARQLAIFIFEKVFSKFERSFFGLENLKLSKGSMPRFELSENLLVGETGEFDMESTRKNELTNHSIKTALTSIAIAISYSDNLFNQLREHSKYIPFALLNPTLALELCANATRVALFASVKYVFDLLAQQIELKNAVVEAEKTITRIAITYLHTGDNPNDTLKLGESIYNSAMDTFPVDTEFEESLMESISLEILRLTFESIRTGSLALPQKYFVPRFREADILEKELSPEITHSADVFMLDSQGKILENIFETYTLIYSDASREAIYLLANQGVENPEYIKKLIKK